MTEQGKSLWEGGGMKAVIELRGGGGESRFPLNKSISTKDFLQGIY